MYKIISVCILATFFINNCDCLGFGGVIIEEPPPLEFNEYETQNKYGTIPEKERNYAIKNGIRPIVDTIYEHEKYGNDGGKIRVLGAKLLQGTEGISAVLGAKFEGKMDQQDYALRGLTSSLNTLGRKLIGLAR